MCLNVCWMVPGLIIPQLSVALVPIGLTTVQLLGAKL